MCEYCILLPFRNYKMFGNTYKLCFLLFSTAFSVWEGGTGGIIKILSLRPWECSGMGA